MSDGRADRESKLPTKEELMTLPRWARVAFAARCAERVRPLFKHFWPEAPEEHIQAVNNACAFVSNLSGLADTGMLERLNAVDAKAPAPDEHVSYAAAAAQNAAATKAVAASHAAGHAVAVIHDAASAHAGHRRPSVYDSYDVNAAANAVAAAAAAHDAYDGIATFIRHDFDLLLTLSRGLPAHNGQQPTPWTDETPVNPDLLGPLWPFGEPEGWPEEAKEPRVGDQRFRIKLTAPPNVSDEEAADAMAELVRRMDRLQRAMGGSGLVIDDDANAFDECLVLQPVGGGA